MCKARESQVESTQEGAPHALAHGLVAVTVSVMATTLTLTSRPAVLFRFFGLVPTVWLNDGVCMTKVLVVVLRQFPFVSQMSKMFSPLSPPAIEMSVS